MQAISLLLDRKEIKSNYLDKNIAIYYLLVIKDFKLKEKINYFILNNINSNNFTINIFYKELKLKNLKIYYLKYLKYIINFIIKAFLFRKEKNILILKFLY